jgi:DNA polymerase delta subunit 1
MLTFRILDMDCQQVKDEQMIIHLAGLTEQGESVYCQVLGYEPYCFLELPVDIKWTQPKINALAEYIRLKLKECPPDIIKFEIKKLCLYSVTRPFLRINFKTEDSLRHLRYTLKYTWKVPGFLNEFPANSFKLHEQKFPTMVKFGIERKLDMAGWVTVKPVKNLDKEKYPPDYSHCKYSVYTKPSLVSKAQVSQDILVDPFVCSFDIELHSNNRKSSSPDPTNPANVITMISLVFGRLSQPLEDWKAYVITQFKGNDELQGKHKAEVIDCKGSEKLLLVNFTKLIKRHVPDIITGYNINGFDWGCLLTRAELHDVQSRFFKMGKLKYQQDNLKDLSWNSNARGNQEIKYIKLNGVFNFDLYPDIRFNHSLPTYKLAAVAKHFLQDEDKEDMPYHQMFAIFDMVEVLERSLENSIDMNVKLAKKLVMSKTTPEELLQVPGMTNHVADFANKLKECDCLEDVVYTAREFMQLLLKYVIQDARIVPALIKFHNSLTSLWENAIISRCPPSFIYEKGQQIKVLAQYLDKAYARNFVVPHYENAKDEVKDDDDDDDKKNYQGATVLKVKKGLYKKIATLDFASLYPSIMRAYNICHTKLVPPDSNIPDEECNIAKWSEHIRCEHDPEKRKKKKGEKAYCGDHCYKWLKHHGKDENKGLLPLMLDELGAYRGRVKKDMGIQKAKWEAYKVKESLTDEEKKDMDLTYRLYTVLDARQNAIKCAMNSSYGTLGALKGLFPLIEGAASVTYYGRQAIAKTIKIVEEKYPKSEVIYGDTDSVFVDFHEDDIATIYRLQKEAETYITSQFPPEMKIAADNIYAPLLLLTKKRYEYCIVNKDGKVIKEDSKGSINKRRDNCDAARQIYTDCLVMTKAGIPQDETIFQINNKILDMYRGLCPLQNFIIYKGLKQLVEDYKNCVGHVLFAKRLEERGNVMKAGTRLEYVFIKKRGKDLASGQRMEDWSYFLMNRLKEGLQIDYGYYLEHNIMVPVTEVLNIAFPVQERQFYKPDEAFEKAMQAYLKPLWVKELKGRSLEYKAWYIAEHSKQKNLRNAAKKYKAKVILDRLYKQHGLVRRRYTRPKKGSSVIFLNDKIIEQIYLYHRDYQELVWQISDRRNIPDWIMGKWG